MKVWLLLTYIFASVLLMVISIPLMQRRIKPNVWYGFRTPKTLRNSELWYDVNAYSGRGLFISGLVTIAAAIVLYPLKLSIDAYATLCAILMSIPLVVSIGLTWWKYLR